MANLQRIIFPILIFFFATIQNAKAEAPVTQYQAGLTSSCTGITDQPFDTLASTQSFWLSTWPQTTTCPNPDVTYFLQSSSVNTTGYITYVFKGQPVGGTLSDNISYEYQFPSRSWCVNANVASSGSICPIQCPSGQIETNGICTKSEGCQKGLPQRGSVPYPGSVNTVCFSGCEAIPINTSNQYYCSGGNSAPAQCSVGTWEQTGATCPSGSPSAGAAPPDTQRCAAGTCPGTVNGVTTCLACTQNNSTTDTSTSTSTNSDGTKSETTTSTTCQGEACTTTTSTKTTPVTGTPTVDTKTEPSKEKKSFCQENPTFSACIQGKFSGSCGSPPACTGDAVQCATARATFEINCTLNTAPSSLSTLGNSLASGTENLTGAGLSSQANREVVNLQTSLDTSKFLATGCPPDRIISLPKGQSITLPFSRLCGVLQFMGSIVIAFSLLAASRIVGVV